MADKRHTEKWIEEVLDSSRGMSRAQPEAGLYERVQGRLAQPAARPGMLGGRRWVAAAALLLAVNTASVVFYAERSRAVAENKAGNPFAAALQTTTYNY